MVGRWWQSLFLLLTTEATLPRKIGPVGVSKDFLRTEKWGFDPTNRDQ